MGEMQSHMIIHPNSHLSAQAQNLASQDNSLITPVPHPTDAVPMLPSVSDTIDTTQPLVNSINNVASAMLGSQGNSQSRTTSPANASPSRMDMMSALGNGLHGMSEAELIRYQSLQNETTVATQNIETGKPPNSNPPSPIFKEESEHLSPTPLSPHNVATVFNESRHDMADIRAYKRRFSDDY